MSKAAMNAVKSAIGPAYMIPSIPMARGRIKMSGIRKIICLVSDRKIPPPGFPMEVKKVVVIGCIKFRKVKNRKILK